MGLNPYDQARWQADRQWRQLTETLAYWWDQFFSTPSTAPSEDVNWLEPLARWLAWGLVILAVGLGLYLVGRWAWQRWQRNRKQLTQTELTSLVAPRPIREWLLLAQTLQDRGDYAGACRAFYMALLLRLRAAGWLSREEAQTNGEYWRQLEVAWAMGKHPLGLRSPIQKLFQTHNQAYYGGQAISAETLTDCQSAYFQVEPDLTHPAP